MDITKLQYGDWVSCDLDYQKPKTEEHRKVFFQIYTIKQGDIYAANLTADRKSLLQPQPIGVTVYPPKEAFDDIPLTPAILIDNGFIATSNDAFVLPLGKKKVVSNYVMLTTGDIQDERWALSIEKSGKMNGTIRINSVRELQHMLREAEIPENIKL